LELLQKKYAMTINQFAKLKKLTYNFLAEELETQAEDEVLICTTAL